MVGLNCLLLALLWVGVQCYPGGAPLDQCVDMQPSVYLHGASEQTTESPYQITPTSNRTKAGESVYIQLKGDSMKGMLLEAREKDTGKIVGSFSYYLPKIFKTLDCNGSNSAITHSSGKTKYPSFVFSWAAPVDFESVEVEFVATVVKSKAVYWRNIRSEPVYVEALGNCTQRDYHRFTECTQHNQILGNLSREIFNPDGVCSQVSTAWNRTLECLGNYHQQCVDAGEDADPSIAQTVADVNKILRDTNDTVYLSYCDECGYVEVNRCFYELVSLDLTDIPTACSAYQRTEDCVAALRERCNPLNRTLLLSSNPRVTQTVNASLQENQHQCQLYDSCTDVKARQQQLEACIELKLPDPFSLDDVCTMAESYAECLRTAIDGCVLLEDLLSGHLAMTRTILASFGCTTAHLTPLESDCNLRAYLECHKPMLESTATMVNASFDQSDSPIDLFLAIQASWPTNNPPDSKVICSGMTPLIDSTRRCLIHEVVKCPFDPVSEQLNVTIPQPQRPERALEALVTLSPTVTFDSFANGTSNLLERAEILQSFTEEIYLTCGEGCDDATERLSGYDECLQDTENFVTAVNHVVQLYQQSQPITDQDCKPIKDNLECAGAHLLGCRATESKMQGTKDARSAQAVGICGLRPHLNYREPSECLDDSYNNHLLTNVDEFCTDITREEFRTLESEQLCGLIQEKASCVEKNAKCCGLKKFVMDPRLFTWSFLYDWLSCDSVLNDTLFVTTPPSGCKLKDVLDCYDPLLTLIGFYYPVVKTPYDLSRISQIGKYFLDKDKRQSSCPSEQVFHSIENCLQEKSITCSYPSVCLNHNIAVVNGSTPLPLSDFMALEQNKRLCRPECRDLDFSPDSLSECEVENLAEYIEAIAWRDVMGTDYQTYCSSLAEVMSCLKDKIGDCTVIRNYIATHLDPGPLSSAAALCDVDVSFLDPEPVEWRVLEFTTTTTTTTTATAQPAAPTVGSQAVGLECGKLPTMCLYAAVLVVRLWFQ